MKGLLEIIHVKPNVLWATRRRLITVVSLGFFIVLCHTLLQMSPAADVTILLWTDFHTTTLVTRYESPRRLQRHCPSGICQYTHNRQSLLQSDAVMFDLRVPKLIKSDNSVDAPGFHPAGQYWIIYNHEAMNLPGEFYKSLPADVFNLSATYARGADIHLPYGKCENRTHGDYILPEGFPAEKQGIVVWHASHCTDRSLRMTYVKRLQNYITVDIVGDCGDTKIEDDKRMRVGRGISHQAKENINKYKFYLAFENTYCKDYVTEKVFKILQDDIFTVPVVRGSGPYKDILPPGSYIDAGDFDGPLRLAQYLKKLDKNDTLYMEFFKSRKHFQCHNYSSHKQSWLCAICDSVSKLKESNYYSTLGEKEIGKLFYKKKNCYFPDKIKDEKILT